MSVKLLLHTGHCPRPRTGILRIRHRRIHPRRCSGWGWKPIEAWATIYGEYPQIMVTLLAPDLPGAQRVLNSREWTTLRDRLQAFVKNYSHKLVPGRTGFQF